MSKPRTLVEANLVAIVAAGSTPGDWKMGSAVVGVIGTLPGVVIGAAAQQLQALRNRTWAAS